MKASRIVARRHSDEGDDLKMLPNRSWLSGVTNHALRCSCFPKLRKSILVSALLAVTVILIWGITSSSVYSQGDFTIIALPDTQVYSRFYPEIFSAQTQWIVENKDSLNIVYVAHEGDIVDNAEETDEWDNADAAMSLLEDPVTTGLSDGIPFGVVPGNHDHPTDNYNIYFGVSRFTGRSYYGGHYGSDNESNYTLFSAGGLDFIVVNLDWYPSSYVLSWADDLLTAYSGRKAIVVSHYILGSTGNFGTPGQNIYDALKDHPNLFLMLCGHSHAEARRTDSYNNSVVHTLLADYQAEPNGGNGWLRIMEFSPANDEIRVKTYSPTLDQYDIDPESEFVLTYDFDPPDQTPTPTQTPTETGTPTQTPTMTSTPSSTPIPMDTSTPTPTSTNTSTPTPTPTSTDTPTPTDTDTPTPTPTPTSTDTPTPTPTPTTDFNEYRVFMPWITNGFSTPYAPQSGLLWKKQGFVTRPTAWYW